MYNTNTLVANMLTPSPNEDTIAPAIVTVRQPYLLTSQLTMGPVGELTRYLAIQ